MRRWLLAVAFLLTAAISASHANYVIIRVILKQPQQDPATSPGGSVFPGGEGGFSPGGVRGGGPGAVGGPPQGAYGGGGGLSPTPGGMRGGVGSAPPGGFGGGSSPPPGSFSGGGIGMPGPGGALGVPGPGSALGNLGGVQGQPLTIPFAKLNPNDYVMAIVEVKKAEYQRWTSRDVSNPDIQIQHKFGGPNGGKTLLFHDGSEVLIQPVKLYTPEQQYKQKLAAKKNKSAEDYRVLAEWCLSVGLVDKAESNLEEMARSYDSNPKDTALTNNTRVPKAVEAYKKMKPDLTRGTAVQNMAKTWKERLGYGGMSISEHYAILHKGDVSKDFLQHRLKLLENQFRTFYLWHATKGLAIPAPQEKLVGVLTENFKDFSTKRNAFDAGQLFTDGFFARRDNLIVFSSERLDDAYRDFQQKKKTAIADTLSEDELLKGDFKKNRKLGGDELLRDNRRFAKAQTLVLVDAALREESDLATISHEGTRQLYAATGMLPRTVKVPEWIDFGLSSVLEMPKGPFPGTFTQVKVAMWPGAGGPSWAYMGYFEELKKAKEISTITAIDALIETITDQGFRTAQNSLLETKKPEEPKLVTPQPQNQGPLGFGVNSPRPQPQAPSPLKEDKVARARTLSWALAHFLANKRSEELQQYFNELAVAPRDLEWDEKANVLAFGRAFNLMNGAGDGLDQEKTKNFAREWFDHMATMRPLAVDLKLDDILGTPANDPNAFPGIGGPGGPGLPGGIGSPDGER